MWLVLMGVYRLELFRNKDSQNKGTCVFFTKPRSHRDCRQSKGQNDQLWGVDDRQHMPRVTEEIYVFQRKTFINEALLVAQKD